MTNESQRPFYLNGNRVEPQLGKVIRDGEDIHLEPKVMAVLCYLARRPDQLISRGELFDALWQHSVVHDMALTRCVTQIRKVFGDTRPHRIIETIPKKGYRFITRISEEEQTSWTDNTARWLAATAAMLIVAVLVVSTTSESTVGVTQARYDDAASIDYERGRSLAEKRTRDAVAESTGWFRRAIDKRKGYSEAHSALSNALSLQAFYWGEPTLEEAERHADLAVELNPLSAQAFNSRGLVYAIQGKSHEAIAESERALALNPDYWQAAHHLANVYFDTDHLDLAAHWYTRTLELNPGNASAIGHLGEIYLRLGDLAQAEQLLSEAWELDPGNRIVIRSFANLRLFQGDTEAVLTSCASLLEWMPDDIRCLHYSALASLLSGDLDGTRVFNTRLEQVEPGHLYTALIRAQTEMYAGDPERAEEILADVEQRAKKEIEKQGNKWYLSWCIAAVQSLRGDVDLATEWLDESLKAGRTFWLWDVYDPALAPLHDDPRFRRYLNAMRDKNDITRSNLREAI